MDLLEYDFTAAQADERAVSETGHRSDAANNKDLPHCHLDVVNVGTDVHIGLRNGRYREN